MVSEDALKILAHTALDCSALVLTVHVQTVASGLQVQGKRCRLFRDRVCEPELLPGLCL